MTADYAAAARRITRTLFISNSLGLAARVAFFPIIAIAGAKLSGRPSWAGVPAMAYQLGVAISAYGWGYMMDYLGRRSALVIALVIGAVGAAGAAVAVMLGSFPAFLLGSVTIGAAVAAGDLSRFVAAEVHPPAERALAISNVVLGGTLGAILGPLLAGATSSLARDVGLDEVAAPYGVSLVLFAAAALLNFAFLRPEPKELARAIAHGNNKSLREDGPVRTIPQIFSVRAVQVAATSMVLGQLVMTMLMVITPLHMRGHLHPLSTISFVISAHVVGMYAFSVISGRLADRWGRGPVIIGGGGVLILACLSAILSPQVLPITLALFLLGLGWNFCYVGGSALLADQLSPLERARTQGFNDLLIHLTSAVRGLGSGIVFAAVGYGAMGLVGAAVALAPLSIAALWQAGRRVPSPQLP